MPIAGQKLISPGNDTGGDSEFAGQVNDLLGGLERADIAVKARRDKCLRRERIGLFFTRVTIAPVIDKEVFFLILYDVASFMKK